MGRDWKKWIADKGLSKWFQRDNLIILVLAGILLVIIALPTKDGTQEGSGASESGRDGSAFSGTSLSGDGSQKEAAKTSAGTKTTESMFKEYADYLEQRLTETLSRMSGVGKVEVMITLKSSCELVVEKEQPVKRSTTNESDSQGGSRMVSQMESEENTVYRTEGSLSEPYVVKTLPPRIEGVVVVAEGAGNGEVNRTVVEIVQALFGVEAHKVRVVKMGTNK